MCGIHAMTNVMISCSWKPQPFTTENFITLQTTWAKVTDLLIPIMVQCSAVQGDKQNLIQNTWDRSGIASILRVQGQVLVGNGWKIIGIIGFPKGQGLVGFGMEQMRNNFPGITPRLPQHHTQEQFASHKPYTKIHSSKLKILSLFFFNREYYNPLNISLIWIPIPSRTRIS